MTSLYSPGEQALLAQKLLHDPFFNEILSKMEREAFENIKNSSLADQEYRDQQYFLLKALELVRQELEDLLPIQQLKVAPQRG